MTNRKGICWMCGRPGRLTEEHAFPDWIRRIFALDGNDIFLSDHRAGIAERSRTWINRSGEVTVRSVCRNCNQGWMSRLETRCKPVLEPLITGHRARLEAAAQGCLALWAVKTAWVFQSRNPTTSTCTAEQRRALATAQAVPLGVRVLLGAYQETGETVLCTNWYAVGSTTAQPDHLDASVTTLVIGRVVLQVTQRLATAQPAAPPASRHPHPPNAVYQLLPPTGQAVDWPPERPLREGDLDDFAKPPDFTARPWDSLPAVSAPEGPDADDRR